MRGRKPKPTIVKMQDGNPGRRPPPEAAPKPEAGLPSPPDFLDAEAKREWRRTGAQLVKERRMAKSYKAIFAAYCASWSRWREAQKNLAEYGLVIKAPSGYLVQSPYVGIANTAWAQMIKACIELGITPTSQARATSVKEPATVSRLDSFINRGKA